jgi:6-phosphogluconolactonase (cycloisomerase 2 family)
MSKVLTIFCVLVTFVLTACGVGGGGGDGTSSYTIGGTLSGLGTGKSVLLQNNGSNGLTLISNGVFTFATSLSDGAAYNVTVATQPGGWNCTVNNGTGTVRGANITNITVSCIGLPADRFVVSGNNDGTLSIFRANSVAGYATAMSYFDAGFGFAVQDMIYDAIHQRLVVITTDNIHVLGFEPDTGEVTAIDSHPTSGSSSHLALNAAGTEAYVASGNSTGKVDAYAIDATGVMSPVVTTALAVDLDYIKLNPPGDHLYVVSRTNRQIVIFGVNSDNSLAASPATVNTGNNPTSLGFNLGGTKAYLTLATSPDNFISYDVAADGRLTQASTYTSSNNNVIDQVLSADGAHLYVLDSSSNRSIDHYTIDATTGAPTYVASTNISFNGNDLALSYIGDQLYVGHGSDALVSTYDVNSADGSLTPVEWVRAFNNANTVATIGGAGTLEPMVTYLLAPDVSGLERYAVAADGMLTLAASENTTGALINGEVAVDYLRGLLLGTGEDTANSDYLTSYTFNPLTGATTAVNALDVTPSSTASFQRIRLDRAGRVMYVLDEDVFSSTTHPTGTLRSYLYTLSGTIVSNGYDSVSVGEGPENMTLNPAGNYLYSINSFGDNISYFKVGYSDGKLTKISSLIPGNYGPGLGRPLDLQFHPNGRYAYLSLEDDDEIDRWTVDTTGGLSNPSRLSTGTGTGPGPIAVHPNGKYVYNGERQAKGIVLYVVNATNYTLSYQSSTTTAAIPSWLAVDPQGKYLLARYNDESIQVFSIDQTTGDLTAVQQVSTGNGGGGGFLPTMTLVAPLQQ